MKQNIILWTASVIIIFVAAYYKTLTSPYYPVSGSFGIQGDKITFKFDKIYRGEKDYQVLIRTDKKDLSAYILWKKENDQEWNKSIMTSGDGVFKTEIPEAPAGSKVYYKAVIMHQGNSFTIPRNDPAVLEFRNKISPAVNGLYYFFLFGGLLLSIRSGLEFFRSNNKVKALSIFTLIFFTLFSFIFSPLRNSYDAGFMKGYLPQPGQLFLIRDIIYFIIILAGIVVMFTIKRWGYPILISSILILAIFLVFGYSR